MADQKLSALSSITIASANDIFYIVSTGASSTSQKITFAQVKSSLALKTFAGTGNKYIMTDTGADTVSSFRLVQSGNSITISTANNNIVINALTGNLSTKQDSISFPLSVGSGGTGNNSFGVAQILVSNDSNAFENIASLSSGSLVVGSATTEIPGVLGVGSQGQILSVDSSQGNWLKWVNSSGAGGVTYAPTGGLYITFSADTLLSNEKVLTAGSSVTITTDAGAVYINAITNAAGAAVAAGSDTQIQVNSQNSLAAFPKLVWANDTGRLSVRGDLYFLPGSNRAIIVQAQNSTNTQGNQLIIQGGLGNGTSGGGEVVIVGGDGGASGAGGDIWIDGGDGGATSGKGGDIEMAGGFAVGDGDGGIMYLQGGDAATSGGTNRNGGYIGLQMGAPAGTGTAGFLQIINHAGFDISVIFDDISASRRVVWPNSSGTIPVAARYPILLSSGGNLSIGTGGTVGQMLITSAGGPGDVAWVNTGGGAGGGTQTIRIPMALLSVKISSANAYWTAKSGVQLDAAHVQFADSGVGIAQYWCEIPNNVSSTENWNIFLKHEVESGSGGNVALTLCGQVMSDGSVFDANTIVLLSARSFPTYMFGTMAVTSMATGVMDNTLGLAANQTFYLAIQRLGNNAGDTVNALWNLKVPTLQLDVNT